MYYYNKTNEQILLILYCFLLCSAVLTRPDDPGRVATTALGSIDHGNHPAAEEQSGKLRNTGNSSNCTVVETEIGG